MKIKTAADARKSLLAVQAFAERKKAEAIACGSDGGAHRWDEVKAFARDGAACLRPTGDR